MTDLKHVWNYFRAGGIVQVELQNTADLLNLGHLDQKLWMALAMPTRGVDIDTRTLDLLDNDKDGKIRPPELVDAIAWLDRTLTDPGIVLGDGDSIPLAQFKNETIKAGAQRALRQLGKAEAELISIDDLEAAVQKLSAEVFNGDGIIIPEATQDEAVKSLIEEIVHHYQSVIDRGGQPGIDQTIVTNFFNDLDDRAKWFAELELNPTLVPLGIEATALAFQATEAVSGKIEDFFTRCHWVAFDPRAQDAANRQESDFIAVADELLSFHSEKLAQFPLARAGAGFALPLDDRLNPAWQKPMCYFADTAVQATLGLRPQELAEAEWQQIQKSLQPYAAWRGREPQSKVARWDMQKIKEISQGRAREALQELIQSDEALAPEFASMEEVLKALLFRRDFGRILRNFINFSDFYRKKDAIFQSGTLFIDGRASELCIEVVNPARHTTMAGVSGAYLAYCDLQRASSPPRTIVALLTDGDSDNLMLGRNGVFYDNAGKDWDATISRIVANPISLREAFWLPYKKLARFVEDQVAKRAAAAETSHTTGLSNTAQLMANVDKANAPDINAGKKIDVGTVAALGVALGSITTFVGLLFSRFLDLGILMPFGIVALVVLISGPSMVLAWMKLKSRNLGPILDANGWAVNTNARINVPFASSMTKLREVPLHAGMLTPDPYAEKNRPWRFYITMGFILLLATAWAMGRLDQHLPEKLRFIKVIEWTKPQQK